MPLRDHFRPPLSARRHWHAFHNAWATYLSSDLNGRLPEGYFAEANVQFGIEIDVAAFEEGARVASPAAPPGNGEPGSGAGWTPPPPVQTVPLTLVTETVEVLLFSGEGGPTLAGAVELVSPAYKDPPAHRVAENIEGVHPASVPTHAYISQVLSANPGPISDFLSDISRADHRSWAA